MINSRDTRLISSTLSIWLQRGSPILTVVLLIAIELLDKTLFKIPNPAPIYLTAVVYAAFSGGLRSGLLSAAIALLYSLYYFSTPGQLFHYTDANLWSLIILAITTPAIALMVGLLKRQVERLTCSQAASSTDEANGISFRDFVQGLKAIVWEKDPATSRLVFVSQQAEAILGYPVEQWLSTPNFWHHHLHPEDGELIEQKYSECILEGKSQEFEFRAIAADGHVVWLRDSVSVIKNAEGHLTKISGLIVDISEYKRTEELLKRYQIFSEHSRDIVLYVSLDGQILEANKAAIKAYGYDRAELLSLKIDSLRAPQTQVLIAEQLDKADKQGILFETIHRRKDGSFFPVEVSAQSTVIGNEKIVLSIIRDITERKRAEEAVQSANRRITNILESITDAFVAFDREWRYTYVNEEAARVLQTPREELLGKQLWKDFLPETIDNIFYREFHRSVAEQIPIEFEDFSQALNLWVEVHLYPSAEGLAVYFRDISDRKRAKENQQKLVSIIENSSDFIGMATLEGQPLYVNEAGQQLVGLESLEQVRQTAILDYFMPEDKAYVQEHILPTIMTQGSWEGEFRFRHFKTGQPIPVYYNLFTTKDRQTGQPIGIGTVTRDITERKQAEAALRESVSVSEAARSAAARSAARFRRLFESNLIGVAFWNVEGFITDANDAYLRLAGYTREEFAELGRINWRELTPPEYKHLDDRAIEETMATGISNIYEKEYVRRDGKRVPVVLGVALLSDSQQDGVAFVLDITERKQMEEALRESNRRITNILESITDAFVALDHEWRITYVNQETARINSQKPEEMIGKTHWEQWPWSVGTIVEREYRRALTSRVAVHLEVLYEPLSMWLEIHAYPSQDGLSIYFRDITERKQIEQSLQVSRDRLDLVLQASELGLWYCDLPFDKLVWNDKCKEHFGLTPDTEVTIDLFYAQLHPDDRERTRVAIEQSIEQRSGYDIDYRTVASDGQVRWIRAIGRGFYDATGNPIRFDGITVDITERKRAEEERLRVEARERQYMRRLQKLAEASVAINSTLSLDEILQLITEQAREIIEAHQSVTSLTVDDNWAQSINAVSLSDKYAQWRGYDQKPDGSGIYTLVCGMQRPLRMTQVELEAHPAWRGFGKEASNHPPMRGWLAVPLTSREGKNIGLIQLSDKYEGEFTQEDEAILIQLAQMASAAIDNARLYQDSQQANRLKDEFLATLSHELRSPLNAMLGWLSLLRTRNFDEVTKNRALETIERNARAQAQLVEDILDVSRIIRGQLRLNVRSVELVPVIESAVDTVRPAAEAKNIRLQKVLDPAAGPVSGDSGRLQQIVWNLLTNAVKFTPKGGRVQIRLERINSHIEITVTDTGKGISADFLPYVFERFRQADSSITRSFGGLGLGLAIVRHLVELHGGTVNADSPGEGLGATFTIKLPLMAVSTKANEPERVHPTVGGRVSFENSPSLEGLRILVVDDEADARDLLIQILKEFGVEVVAVATAEEAVRVLTEQASRLDVLVSDIGMPNEDGYTLLRRVRSLPPERGGRIPAVALTAYARTEDRRAALLAGFQFHVAKPVELAELIAAIASLTGRTG
jgi:PAS domain S-box-containing protein